MTGIEMLRDVCKALKGSPWCGTDIATIGGEPAYEKLSKIADQIERETLPRPRFEDGEPVQFGDEFQTRDGVGIVECIQSYKNSTAIVRGGGCDELTHGTKPLKRPEPPDTWERIEADVAKGDACHYFGFADDDGCDGCKANYSDMGCSWEMANDVLGRAKKLAGVE